MRDLDSNWFIDPTDLRLIKRFPTTIGGLHYVAPGDQSAFQVASIAFKGSKPSGTLVGHDLTGKAPPVLNALENNGIFTMTRDGKFLYGVADGKLMRWRNDNRKLVRDVPGETARCPSAAAPILSPDGQWLLRRYDHRQKPPDDVDPAPKSGFGWIGYRTADLLKPAFAIDTEAYSMVAVFDPKSGHVYTHSPARGIMICDTAGKVLRTIAEGMEKGQPVRTLIVHPEGGRFLAFVGIPGTTNGLYVEP